jgi:hypothetical protein
MYTVTHTHIEELTLRGPLSSPFWFPRNISNHMDRLTCTRDIVLVSIVMTGGSLTARVAGGRRGTDDKIHWPRCIHSFTPHTNTHTLNLSSANIKTDTYTDNFFRMFFGRLAFCQCFETSAPGWGGGGGGGDS